MINYPSDWTKMRFSWPFVGKWKQKATMLEKIWMQPCSPSPLLFILGSFAATPAIVFSLLTPDCLDHTFDRIGRPHSKRRGVGINVADHATPIAAPTGGVGWAMWGGAKFAQKIGWYALMVDGLLDWQIYGTSFAYQMNGCDDPLQGYATSEMVEKVWALIPAGTFFVNTWDVVDTHIFTADGASIVTPAGHEAGAGFSLNQILGAFEPLQDCSYTAYMIDQITFAETKPITPYLDNNGNMSAVQANFGGAFSATGHNFRVIVEKSAGVLYGNGNFTAGGLNMTSFSPSACGRNIDRPF